MTLLVVRHTSAGDREHWTGDDRLRPLDPRGERGATRLPELLEGRLVRAIVSSPYVRCVQTVEPLARELVLETQIAEELSEERQHIDGLALMRRLFDEDAVVCVHGGAADVLGVSAPFHKGTIWLFERSDLARPKVLGRA